MSKQDNFQERYLISLDKSDGGLIIRKILESPNNLAIDIIKVLFSNNFEKIKLDLDSIKKFVAGISRADSFSKSYRLANYYGYLFSFHQYFHSSYRARQGKALEALLNQILRECGDNFFVADKTNEKIKLIKELFPKMKSKLDLDAVCRKNTKSYLTVQLRSRDDTGGTTAKGSLVDFLRKSFDWKKNSRKKLLYLVTIWDAIDSNQKKITKSKIYENLKHIIGKQYSEKKFIDSVEQGIKVRDGVVLKMVYGTEDLAKTLGGWAKPEAKIDFHTINKMIKKVESWDDLWLSYAMVSLELDNQKIAGFSNAELLKKYISKDDIKTIIESDNQVLSANKIALKIAPSWKENSIPANSLSEKIHYIRDLILLRCIYEIS
ncbi:hypothetical protein A3I50_03685 [Candidatus Roizmanbacteria bacterium RIFCSPLOWO2_02_FULL_37_9]|uniref:Uncharacterized protein n=1 Tax=Candidatus Roizmanbacteria bacterium RIFCSPLOWO2_01_FULL_35_13 TaxID=1802055 RepID=A0A1F7ICE3_9BACT|nr:MAG: hypothetical protein A3A74_01435 [Candidatus Roizmanbacteria bacterium RIFCSPLOWO2_01_FULL_35_13]OGK55625.1 MAG: hypothetical protein A3I50_03685 [Candidatus Roizmanbacteria bacterium RIFCSPLOWO2_02_FULL_37_9]